jgi:hypothetical protein
MYWGLAYPIIVAALTFVVGMLLLPEKRDVRIWDELEAIRAGTTTSEEGGAVTTAPSGGGTPAPAG